MSEAKLVQQIRESQFGADLGVDLNVNGHNLGRGMYNLLVSIRDVKLFCAGLKPNRTWTLKSVKAYFNLTGGKVKCLEQLEAYKVFLQS